MQKKYLRLPDVQKITQLARTTIWRLERNDEFPKRRRLSKNAVGWLESEIEAWIESREKVGGAK